MYVTVKEESAEHLHLAREPSLRSWAVCVGIVAFGVGAAYYSTDSLLWQAFCICGSTFVAISCMEEWESCLLDKQTGKVTLASFSLMQRLVKPSAEQKKVVTNLHDIGAVKVEENPGQGHHVVLLLNNGIKLGITELCTVDNTGEHAQVAEKIRRFLQLDDRVNLPKPASSSSLGSQGSMPSSESFPESLYAEDNQSTASSDDSFEQIDRAELVVNGNSKDTPEGLDNEEKH